MSNSSDCWKSSAQKLPEKPSFSQTCSRLSRYLKQNGSFGDLSLGMTCNPDINGGFVASREPKMMNLFPCDASTMDQDIKPMILFPKESSLSSSSSSSGTKEEIQKIIETKFVKPESQSSPLTIFYGGQVFVFDDFTSEKAKQVIDLANKGSAYSQNVDKNQKEISPAKTVPQELIQTNTSSLACELPIARRASLHRFLAKRKDRITSKAPYQIDGSAEASSKPAWLGSQ